MFSLCEAIVKRAVVLWICLHYRSSLFIESLLHRGVSVLLSIISGRTSIHSISSLFLIAWDALDTLIKRDGFVLFIHWLVNQWLFQCIFILILLSIFIIILVGIFILILLNTFAYWFIGTPSIRALRSTLAKLIFRFRRNLLHSLRILVGICLGSYDDGTIFLLFFKNGFLRSMERMLFSFRLKLFLRRTSILWRRRSLSKRALERLIVTSRSCRDTVTSQIVQELWWGS